MILRPPISTRTETFCPYTTLFRAPARACLRSVVHALRRGSRAPRNRRSRLRTSCVAALAATGRQVSVPSEFSRPRQGGDAHPSFACRNGAHDTCNPVDDHLPNQPRSGLPGAYQQASDPCQQASVAHTSATTTGATPTDG